MVSPLCEFLCVRPILVSWKIFSHTGSTCGEIGSDAAFSWNMEALQQKKLFILKTVLPVVNECWLGSKTSATVGAEEVSFSSVHNIVNSQLLRKCKLFSTHIALKWFLS